MRREALLRERDQLESQRRRSVPPQGADPPPPSSLRGKASRNRLQCCGSGMFIPDPDFYPSRIPDLVSRIPDPKTATKERGEKKLVVIPFFVATNFTKLQIILFY